MGDEVAANGRDRPAAVTGRDGETCGLPGGRGAKNRPLARGAQAGQLRFGDRFLPDEAPGGPDQQFAAAEQSRGGRSEEHTSELQSLAYLVCRLLLEKKTRR